MADLDSLGAEKFLSLTTFKRSGDAVSTPLWVISEGGRLVFWTPAQSWKVKRVRRDPRVTVVPCSRRGKVAPGVQPVAGRAELVEDAAEVDRTQRLFRKKYGLGFVVVTTIERVIRRGRERRVLLRVDLDLDG
ncbi:PPOX class F420-dependent oxidoreductase [Mycolicibacterium sp. F2034L]|uniref:PPOX class F420-dependent oxidoreductase n=1 Tax=Mycolicibacterium sp. F2034L TaxID=2926422 RepID=UPI001FF6D7F9|nr:PPOX class F420-dependent oxidoreductase [Mycolicibacterium sp. F2034L]MCK0173795.1 PPOX class F420-dependent oxidoreductase [Mycolicibacterium sp. F2034L]